MRTKIYESYYVLCIRLHVTLYSYMYTIQMCIFSIFLWQNSLRLFFIHIFVGEFEMDIRYIHYIIVSSQYEPLYFICSYFCITLVLLMGGNL